MFYVLENNIMIPVAYYVEAILLGIVEAVVMKKSRWGKDRKTIEAVPVFLLTAYVFFVLSSTVFSREGTGIFSYQLKLFWSYGVAHDGDNLMFWEIFFNYMMLLPVGFLYPLIMKSSWWLSAIQGFSLSLFIELSQLITKRGLFEFDDILHNTIGCIIGYFLISGILWLFRKKGDGART